MVVTRKGIYHNLRESKYAISNSEIAYFFSSRLYLNKFLEEYEINRIKNNSRFLLIDNDYNLNFDSYIDLFLYRRVEKRGFRCEFLNTKGVELSWLECLTYVSRKMIDQCTISWQEIANEK